MKRVFLSFLAEDSQRVDGVRLLASNPNYQLEFYDESVTEPYDSVNADYIKARIRDKINRTSVTVCFISELTYTSRWVNWELEESFKKGNKVIAMALKGVNEAILPTLIKENGIYFHGWDPSNLHNLINN